MKSDFLIIFSLSVLKIKIDLFLFKISFEWFISKLSSFDSFLIIDLKSHIMIINEIIDKNERFSAIDILLLLYSHYSKTNNILFLNISRMISYLFIYNFLKIRSCCLNWTIKIKHDSFLCSWTFNVSNKQYVINRLNNWLSYSHKGLNLKRKYNSIYKRLYTSKTIILLITI